MKRNKLAILAVMALGGLMACGPIARADDTTTPPAKPDAPPAAQGGPRLSPLERMTKALDLTDDQKAKIKPILAEQSEKMKALRDDTSLTREDRMPKMKEIRDAANAKIKPILTADQLPKFEKFLQQQGRRRGQGAAATPNKN